MGVQTRFRLSQEVTARYLNYELVFKKPAQTSRDTMRVHRVKYLILENENGFGIGEYAPIPGLSLESPDTFDVVLQEWQHSNEPWNYSHWRSRSSAFAFALETACWHFQNSLSTHFKKIPINGLVWMNGKTEMELDALRLLENGFDCIKLKVGALKWEEECGLIQNLRSNNPMNWTLRLDANGGFDVETALKQLNQLAQWNIHSIEQPIRSGQWQDMAELCKSSPIPIALDEELIGVHDPNQKRLLLETIKPAFIVLKPTLHGGLQGIEEWIELAQQLHIKWWVTSALESNIGLYAIAQWVDYHGAAGHQGLGTGSLYTNNIVSPMTVKNGHLVYENDLIWDIEKIATHLA